jgi:deoxyguanosine kinase
MHRTVYIGVGSNILPREVHMNRGLALLEELLVERRAVTAMTLSPWYETEAWGMPSGTQAFLNMVLAVDTDLSLNDLLHVLLEVEQTMGRIRTDGNGYQDRTLDMDILCTSLDERHDSELLAVPHPRMASRRFVLQPLMDLAPTLVLDGQPIEQALNVCPELPAVIPFIPQEA